MNEAFDQRAIERRIDAVQQISQQATPAIPLDREEEDIFEGIPQELPGGSGGTVGEFFLATQHIELGAPQNGETWWRVDLLNETAEWVLVEPAFPCDPRYHYGKISDSWPIHLGRAGM